MEAIDPLVAMAHECHSVDSRRRAAVALDCLMAYESFERDWHLEKLNQPVIDRVKLAVTTENEKLIQKMIGDDRSYDLSYRKTIRKSLTGQQKRSVASPLFMGNKTNGAKIVSRVFTRRNFIIAGILFVLPPILLEAKSLLVRPPIHKLGETRWSQAGVCWS